MIHPKISDIVRVSKKHKYISKGMEESVLKALEKTGKIGVAYTTYQSWEDIDRFSPTLKTLKKIADVPGRKVVIDLEAK